VDLTAEEVARPALPLDLVAALARPDDPLEPLAILLAILRPGTISPAMLSYRQFFLWDSVCTVAMIV
jgi:hypothetical protein